MHTRLHTRVRALASCTLISLAIPIATLADIEIGDAVTLGDDMTTLRSKLQSSCKAITRVTISPPRFPLAENNEQHLICDNYAQGDIRFSKTAFTLADDRLVRMEATGIAPQQVKVALGEASAAYLDYEIYGDGLFWLSETRNTVIWLDSTGLHPNLFAWRNPLAYGKEYPYTPTAVVHPQIAKFETSLNQQIPQLEASCSPLLVEEIAEIWLQNQPQRQTQANCFNYPYAGFERKLELVFGDGRLQVVWILTAKAEEQRIREHLIAQWGSPDINNATWEVFEEGRISLRKDLPELLLLSDEMIPLYIDALTNPDQATDSR